MWMQRQSLSGYSHSPRSVGPQAISWLKQAVMEIRMLLVVCNCLLRDCMKNIFTPFVYGTNMIAVFKRIYCDVWVLQLPSSGLLEEYIYHLCLWHQHDSCFQEDLQWNGFWISSRVVYQHEDVAMSSFTWWVYRSD